MLRERAVESYLPLVVRSQQWKDRTKLVAFPLFPSYIFARFSLPQLSQVLSVPGIVSVVRSEGQPLAVPEDEIANVRRFVEGLASHGGQTELVALPRQGDRVRITAGPFQGVEALVIEPRNRCRVLVGLQAIGWGVQVEVEAADLAPLRV